MNYDGDWPMPSQRELLLRILTESSKQASTVKLLQYVDEDVKYIRFRMETGRQHPMDTRHGELSAADTLVAYAVELRRRGY